jgi:hypothetical protein
MSSTSMERQDVGERLDSHFPHPHAQFQRNQTLVHLVHLRHQAASPAWHLLTLPIDLVFCIIFGTLAFVSVLFVRVPITLLLVTILLVTLLLVASVSALVAWVSALAAWVSALAASVSALFASVSAPASSFSTPRCAVTSAFPSPHLVSPIQPNA